MVAATFPYNVLWLACVLQRGGGTDFEACTSNAQQSRLEPHLSHGLDKHSSLLQHRAARVHAVGDSYNKPSPDIRVLKQDISRSQSMSHAAHRGGDLKSDRHNHRRKTVQQSSSKGHMDLAKGKDAKLARSHARSRSSTWPELVVHNVLIIVAAMIGVAFFYKGALKTLWSSSAQEEHSTTKKDVQIAAESNLDNGRAGRNTDVQEDPHNSRADMEKMRNPAQPEVHAELAQPASEVQDADLPAEAASASSDIQTHPKPLTVPAEAASASPDIQTHSKAVGPADASRDEDNTGASQNCRQDCTRVSWEKAPVANVAAAKDASTPANAAAAASVSSDVRKPLTSASLLSADLPQLPGMASKYYKSTSTRKAVETVDASPPEVAPASPDLKEAVESADAPPEEVSKASTGSNFKEALVADVSCADDEVDEPQLQEQRSLSDRIDALRELKELKANQNATAKLEEERRQAIAAMAEVEAEQDKLLEEELVAERAFKRLPYKVRCCASKRIGEEFWASSSWRSRLAAAEEDEGTQKKRRKKKPVDPPQETAADDTEKYV